MLCQTWKRLIQERVYVDVSQMENGKLSRIAKILGSIKVGQVISRVPLSLLKLYLEGNLVTTFFCTFPRVLH